MKKFIYIEPRVLLLMSIEVSLMQNWHLHTFVMPGLITIKGYLLGYDLQLVPKLFQSNVFPNNVWMLRLRISTIVTLLLLQVSVY